MISDPFDRLPEQWEFFGSHSAARILSCLLILTSGSIVFALASGAASADDQIVGLAAPGPCAEPREAIAGDGESSFSVVGPVAALLSPLDVAAGPAPPPGLGPPVSSRLSRPGPCDGPDSGCWRLGATTPGTSGNGGVTNRPIVPGGPPGG